MTASSRHFSGPELPGSTSIGEPGGGGLDFRRHDGTTSLAHREQCRATIRIHRIRGARDAPRDVPKWTGRPMKGRSRLASAKASAARRSASREGGVWAEPIKRRGERDLRVEHLERAGGTIGTPSLTDLNVTEMMRRRR